jgi:Holliday junction resolvase
LPNRNKQKGTRFEYEWMYFMMYHHFDNVRSYASIGVADVRSVPPVWAKNKMAVAAQCKNTKKGDYITPVERDRLQKYAEKFAYLVVEPFKKNHKVFVKLEPWKLDGEILSPDEFLYREYGIFADSWTKYRSNWNNGIKRKKFLINS